MSTYEERVLQREVDSANAATGSTTPEFYVKPASERKQLPFISARADKPTVYLDYVERKLAERIQLPALPNTMHSEVDFTKVGSFTDRKLIKDEASAAQRDLARDIFWSLYQQNNEFVEKVPPERAMNKAMIDLLMQQPDFNQAKHETMYNIPAASTALQPLMYYIQQKYKKELEAQEALEKAKRENAPQAQQDMLQREYDQAVKRIQRDAGRPDAGAAEAMAEAAEGAGRTNDLQKAFGIKPGQGMGDALEQVQTFFAPSEIVRAVAELLGRLRGGWGRPNRQAEAGDGHTVTGLERSAITKLNRLTPNSYARMGASHLTKAMTLADIVNGADVAIAMGAGARDGNFICCTDGSGSMSSFGDFDPDDPNAKRYQKIVACISMAIALMLDALDNGRNAHWCSFSGYVHEKRKLSLEAGDERMTPAKLIQKMTDYDQGGTEFNAPLKFAMEKAEKDDSADIIFITDGEGSCDDETLEQLDTVLAKGTKLYLVLIGTDRCHPGLQKRATNIARWKTCSPKEVESVYHQLEAAVNADKGAKPEQELEAA